MGAAIKSSEAENDKGVSCVISFIENDTQARLGRVQIWVELLTQEQS
jgi:hypothetical protein